MAIFSDFDTFGHFSNHPPAGTPHFGNKVSNMGPIFFPVYGQSQRRTVSRDMPFFSVIGRTHERKQTHD